MTASKTYEAPRQWRGVQFSDEFIARVSGNKIEFSLPRQLVRGLVLRHGWQSKHPIFMACIGLVLVAVAIALPHYYFLRAASSGSLLIISPALFLIVAGFGFGLAYKALSRGYFLEVMMDGGTQRIGFRNQPKIEDVERYLKTVEEKFGYTIERGVATAGFEVIKPQQQAAATPPMK